MTPEAFIKIWTENDLTEKAGAQAFIEDLCSLLQLDKPRSSNDYCYEKALLKTVERQAGRMSGNSTTFWLGKQKTQA
jgi:hypothetical protein